MCICFNKSKQKNKINKSLQFRFAKFLLNIKEKSILRKKIFKFEQFWYKKLLTPFFIAWKWQNFADASHQNIVFIHWNKLILNRISLIKSRSGLNGIYQWRTFIEFKFHSIFKWVKACNWGGGTKYNAQFDRSFTKLKSRNQIRLIKFLK